MNGLTVIVTIYRRLLRIYPAAFRAQYADEMCAVFTQGLHESAQRGGLAVIWFLLRELPDLPRHAFAEYLSERKKILQYAGTVSMSTTSYDFKLRFCAIALLTGIVLHLLLVVLPFFVYGMHLQPADYVAGGTFDPKGYPIYTDDTWGAPLRMATMVLLGATPVLVTAIGGLLFVTLRHGWRNFSRAQRFVGVFILLISISTMAFIFSPLGRLIMAWQAD